MRSRGNQTYVNLLAAGAFVVTAAAGLSTTTTTAVAAGVPTFLWPLMTGNEARVWSFNTVKQKMIAGTTLHATAYTSNTATGGNPGSNIANLCAVATVNAGDDFVWSDMAFADLEYAYAGKSWATLSTCAAGHAPLIGAEAIYGKKVNYTTKAYYRAPDPAVDYLNNKEMSRVTDGGAMVIIIQTDNANQAQEVVKRTYYPMTTVYGIVGQRDIGPIGIPSSSKSGLNAEAVYPTVGGGSDTACSHVPVANPVWPDCYTGTYNENVTVFVKLSTIEGVSNADAIAAIPGIHGVFVDTADLQSESGYAAGSPDWNFLVQHASNAFLELGKYVCIPKFNTTVTSQTTANTMICSNVGATVKAAIPTTQIP